MVVDNGKAEVLVHNDTAGGKIVGIHFYSERLNAGKSKSFVLVMKSGQLNEMIKLLTYAKKELE